MTTEIQKFSLAMLAAFILLLAVLAYCEITDTLKEIQESVTAWQPVMDSHNAKQKHLFTPSETTTEGN